MLRVNVSNSENIIRNIIKANSKKQFFMVLHQYLTRLPLYSNEKIRDTLYNIEQFKYDAMLEPEIKLGATSGNIGSNQSNNSTSSSSKSSVGSGER